MTGAGGSDEFCIASGGSTSGACADYVDAAEASINVVITTMTFANEITWDIDSGNTFGLNPAFADNSATTAVITLPAGDHVIHYFDSYGDGWHGGYWEITDCLGTNIAGGPTVGAVAGAGSETTFTVASVANCPGAGAGTPPPPPPVDLCADVTCPTPSDSCMVAGACTAGVCSMADALTDGTSCDDSDISTAQDSCAAGVCTGTAIDRCAGVTCPAVTSACKVAGTCAAGSCGPETDATNGLLCDDGDIRTDNDMCLAGSCAGSVPPPPPPSSLCARAAPCPPATDVCQVGGSCQEADGLCSAPTNRADGTSCAVSGVVMAAACQAGVCTVPPPPAPPPPPTGACTIGTDDPDNLLGGVPCSLMMTVMTNGCDTDLGVLNPSVYSVGTLFKSVCMATCNECLPTAPGVCADSTTWNEATHDTWDCASYAVGAGNDGYCSDLDAAGVSATTACPVSCNSCPPPPALAPAPTPTRTPPPPAPGPAVCADDASWMEATHPNWSCSTYAAGASNDGYCVDVDASGVSANIACPVSCNTCSGVINNVPSPLPTPGAPTPTPPGPAPPVVAGPPPPPADIVVELTLSIDIASISADLQGFQDALTIELSTLVGIAEERIAIINVGAGSVVVRFVIFPGAAGEPSPADALATLMASTPAQLSSMTYLSTKTAVEDKTTNCNGHCGVNVFVHDPACETPRMDMSACSALVSNIDQCADVACKAAIDAVIAAASNPTCADDVAISLLYTELAGICPEPDCTDVATLPTVLDLPLMDNVLPPGMTLTGNAMLDGRFGLSLDGVGDFATLSPTRGNANGLDYAADADFAISMWFSRGTECNSDSDWEFLWSHAETPGSTNRTSLGIAVMCESRSTTLTDGGIAITTFFTDDVGTFGQSDFSLDAEAPKSTHSKQCLPTPENAVSQVLSQCSDNCF